MLRLLAMGFIAIVALLIAVGLALPRRWHVERQVKVDAPVTRIQPYIANLQRWQEWSPWTKELDPQVRHSYGGPQEGVGASWSWLGPKMGRGRMVITAADASGVQLDEAIETDEVNARARLKYVPDGEGTLVTWADDGTLPWVFGGYVRATVETQLGAHFEAGLSKLKRVVEASAQAPAQ